MIWYGMVWYGMVRFGWALGNAYWARYAADHLRLSPIPASVLPERSLLPVFLHATTHTLHHLRRGRAEIIEEKARNIGPASVTTFANPHCSFLSRFISLTNWLL